MSARERVDVLLEVGFEPVDPTNRLRLRGIVPDVAGREVLVDHAPVALPGVLEELSNDRFGISHRAPFRPPPTEPDDGEDRCGKPREEQSSLPSPPSSPPPKHASRLYSPRVRLHNRFAFFASPERDGTCYVGSLASCPGNTKRYLR